MTAIFSTRMRVNWHLRSRRRCGQARARENRSMNAVIRRALVEEYDEIARVWMESWVSTGLGEASDFLLANLRARIRKELADGWSLYVADDDGSIAAMLALPLPKRYLDRRVVAPQHQVPSAVRQRLALSRTQ